MSAEAKIGARRASPIHCYTGPNGSGKSLAAVLDTLPSLDKGRRVLSTVRLLDPETGEQHPAYEKLTDWSQLLEAEHCDVIFDEVVGIASSRDSMSLPAPVANLLVQLRRRDITLRVTAPAFARMDKIIRECAQAVTECRGYFADTSAQRAAAKEGTDVPAWAPKRLFRFNTFSAVDFSEWSDGKRERLRVESRQWFWGPNSRAFRAYDTLDSVARVGEVLDSGRCVDCGGRRPIPQCKCDNHDAPKRGTKAAAPAPAPANQLSLDSAVLGETRGDAEGYKVVGLGPVEVGSRRMLRLAEKTNASRV